MRFLMRLSASVTTPSLNRRRSCGFVSGVRLHSAPAASYFRQSIIQLRTCSAVAAPESEYPTFVPRNPKVIDGEWNKIDVEQVKFAQKDADGILKEKRSKEEPVLLGRSLSQMEQLAEDYGQPKYRGKQMLDALMQGMRSVEDMKTIPKELRQRLVSDGIRSGRSIIHLKVAAPDGTTKFLLQQADGRLIECVGIPADGDDGSKDNRQEQGVGNKSRGRTDSSSSSKRGSSKRLTVCVSSQVGCPMRCTFCATGKGGFARNLKPHEILDQVMTVQEEFGQRVTNVVFMGMGEPLLNLPAVTVACQLLNEQYGLGARFITVSTVGVPNAIKKMAYADLRATLAVSIHAPNQVLREQLIPSAKAYPLEALMEDCATFYRKTGRRVTYEYTLMADVNDGKEHAEELAKLLKFYNLKSHVNVIPWNPVDETEFKRPSGNRVHNFKQTLEAAGIPATIRVTRGTEASAACGQLRNQHQKTPLADFLVPK